MPNLQGASPVSRGGGGRLYAAPTVSRSGSQSGYVEEGEWWIAADGRVYSRAIELPGGEQAGTTCGPRTM